MIPASRAAISVRLAQCWGRPFFDTYAPNHLNSISQQACFPHRKLDRNGPCNAFGMRRSIPINALLLVLTLTLPGCLVINAALGVVGLLGSGPIQYAGTAYSVGEYAYELAVNDRTPDDVIEGKIAFLSGSEALDPDIAAHKGAGYDHATAKAHVFEKEKIWESFQRPIPARLTPKKAPAMSRPQSSVVLAHNRSTQPNRRPTQNRAIARQQPQPITHTYVERNPDALFVKLNRMRQAFPQAELAATRVPETGVRVHLQEMAADQSTTSYGVNGSWSIRHTVPPSLL